MNNNINTPFGVKVNKSAFIDYKIQEDEFSFKNIFSIFKKKDKSDSTSNTNSSSTKFKG